MADSIAINNGITAGQELYWQHVYELQSEDPQTSAPLTEIAPTYAEEYLRSALSSTQIAKEIGVSIRDVFLRTERFERAMTDYGNGLAHGYNFSLAEARES